MFYVLSCREWADIWTYFELNYALSFYLFFHFYSLNILFLSWKSIVIVFKNGVKQIQKFSLSLSLSLSLCVCVSHWQGTLGLCLSQVCSYLPRCVHSFLVAAEAGTFTYCFFFNKSKVDPAGGLNCDWMRSEPFWPCGDWWQKAAVTDCFMKLWCLISVLYCVTLSSYVAL